MRLRCRLQTQSRSWVRSHNLPPIAIPVDPIVSSADTSLVAPHSSALEKVIEEKEQLRRRLLARASATPESTPQTQADSSINVHSPLPDPTPDPVVQEPGGPPGGPFGSEESTSDALYDLHGVYVGADSVAELFEQ